MASLTLRSVKGTQLTNNELDANFSNLNTELASKQNMLVSGTSIKTVNGVSVLGSGNIQIDGGVTSFNSRTGAVTLSSGDVTGALGFTPVNKAGDTMTGNLAFSGTGLRITGDFSNATRASRLLFQTSTANSNTFLSLIPNGTGGGSGLDVHLSGTDPDNTAFGRFAVTSASVNVRSGVSGTGTQLPMDFYIGSSIMGRLSTAGNWLFGTTADNATDKIQVVGSVSATSFSGSGANLTGLTSGQITTALGFTPYNATNPSGYITNTGNARVGVENNGTLIGTRRNINFIPGSGISLSISDDAANEEVDVTITSTATGGVTSFNTRTGAVTLSSGDVTTALGFTPYNATNPSGYITSSALSSYLPLSGDATRSGTTTLSGVTVFNNYISLNGDFYHNGSQYILNAAQNGWINIVSRNGGNPFINNVTYNGSTILHAGNYTSYSPSLGGSGASGTWGINISGNAASVSGINAGQFFNNMGNNHSTYTNFNSVPGAGAYYLQGPTNGPTGIAGNQFYGFTLGLGNEYPLSSYGSQIYYPRRAQNSDTYIYVRDMEGGSWTSWTKIRAGYADTAGSVSSISATTATGIQTNYVAGINTTTPGQTTYGIAFSGSSSTDNAQGITWGWSGTAAQAGIYVQSSGAYGTKMYFGTTDSFATGSKTSMSIDHVGNVNLPRGTFSNGSVWINNGANFNAYNENIRLFDAPNGVSVIGFSASGISGRPTTSILGFSDRWEVRFGDGWQQRTYNGYVEAAGSFRAPIFYDSNNTAYYTDPASTSVLNAVNFAGTSSWIGSAGAMALQLATNDGYASMRVIQNRGSSNQDGMYIGYENINGGITRIFGGGATTGAMIKYASYTEEANSFRAPIFYDSNDTGYYTDPNGGSALKYLRVDGNWGSSPFAAGLETLTVTGTYASICQRATNLGQAYVLHHVDDQWSLYIGRGATNGSDWNWAIRAKPTQDGNFVEFRTSARAPIFYDSNDTGYYVNPNGMSQMSGILANDWFRPQGASGVYWETYGRGIRAADSEFSYGNIGTYGAGLNGWRGYGVYPNTCILMCDGSNWGMYRPGYGWMLISDMGGNATFSGNVTAYSDLRLKDNVREIDNVVERRNTLAMSAIKYERDGRTRIGYGAQILRDNGCAEFVMEADDALKMATGLGTLSVDYGETAAILAVASKMTDDRVVNLEAKIARLEAIIEKLIGD